MAAAFIYRNPKRFSISKALFSTQTNASAAATTTPFPSFRAAKSVILSETNPEKIAQLFEQSAHFPAFRRHRPIFEVSVRKLTRAKRPDLVDRLLQTQTQIQDSPLMKSEGFWIRLMMLYSSSGMVDKAMDILDLFAQNKHFDLSEKSLCAVLSAHFKNGLFDKVHQLFDTMPQRLGVTPGVASNNVVLKAFVREDKIESARKWLEKMESGDGGVVAPTVDSYNILLGGYWKIGDMNAFDGILKKVLDKGLECNLTTYNYRIVRLCKEKKCARAKKLIDEMVAKGLKPSSASYSPVIDGFCRLGDFESAKKVLNSMLSDNFAVPNSFIYYTLLSNMVRENEFESALEVCKEIVKKNWVPPFQAMEGLVRGLVGMSRVDDAKEVVEKMKRKLKGNAVESWGKIEAALPL